MYFIKFILTLSLFVSVCNNAYPTVYYDNGYNYNNYYNPSYILSDIEYLEKTIFNKVYYNDDIENRLARLEKHFYGTTQYGTVESRLGLMVNTINNPSVKQKKLSKLLRALDGVITGYSPQINGLTNYSNYPNYPQYNNSYFDLYNGGGYSNPFVNNPFNRYNNTKNKTGINIKILD